MVFLFSQLNEDESPTKLPHPPADIIFDNAYTTSSGSDVSVTCLVSNNKEAPESITVTGPTAFTSSLKNGSSNVSS